MVGWCGVQMGWEGMIEKLATVLLHSFTGFVGPLPKIPPATPAKHGKMLFSKSQNLVALKRNKCTFQMEFQKHTLNSFSIFSTSYTHQQCLHFQDIVQAHIHKISLSVPPIICVVQPKLTATTFRSTMSICPTLVRETAVIHQSGV